MRLHSQSGAPPIHGSPARSASRTPRLRASGWSSGSTRYIGSSSRWWCWTPSPKRSSCLPAPNVIARSMSPARSAATAASGSTSVIESSTAGWAFANAAIATGMIVAAADSNAASRSRPPRRPAIASSSASASASRPRMPSAWRTTASPASVSRTPRALRSTSTAPASRSSAAICCEIADWVNDSDSAAAEKEPRRATSRRTRMRRTSSISATYTRYAQRSFVLMGDDGRTCSQSPNPPQGAHHAEPRSNRRHPSRPWLRRRRARAASPSSTRSARSPATCCWPSRTASSSPPSPATRVIADPFRSTADLVALLRVRAGRSRQDRGHRARVRVPRLRRRVNRSLLPRPAPRSAAAGASAPRRRPPFPPGPRIRRAPSGLLVWAALWTVYIVWGSTYLALRVLVETIPPLVSTGSRFLLAGSLMLGVLALRRRPVRITRREALSCLLVGSLMMGAVATVATAEQDVPSNLAALLVACVPLWVLLLRRARRRADRRCGSCSRSCSASRASRCCCSRAARPAARRCCRCCSSSARRRPGRRARTSRGASRCRRTRSSPSAGRCCSAARWSRSRASSQASPGRSTSRPSRRESVLAWLYLALIGSALAFTAYAWLLQNAPISRVATYAYVNPVVAIVLGYLILDEAVTGLTVAGAAVIVLAVAVVVRGEAKPPRARPRATARAPAPACPTSPGA